MTKCFYKIRFYVLMKASEIGFVIFNSLQLKSSLLCKTFSKHQTISAKKSTPFSHLNCLKLLNTEKERNKNVEWLSWCFTIFVHCIMTFFFSLLPSFQCRINCDTKSSMFLLMLLLTNNGRKFSPSLVIKLHNNKISHELHEEIFISLYSSPSHFHHI